MKTSRTNADTEKSPMTSEELQKEQKMKDALRLVNERYSVTKKYTQSYFQRFQRFYKLYRSYLDRSRLPWRSNLFIPRVYEIVEVIAPRIVMAQRTYTVNPVEGNDVENARAYADLLKFQFYQDRNEEMLEELVKETLIYGTGVVKTCWDQEANMPHAEVVDIFDFYPDPKARTIEEAKYVIHRVDRDLDELKKNPNYSKEALARLEKATGQQEDNRWRKLRLGVEGIVTSDSSRRRFEVLEYHGDWNGEFSIIVVAGGEVLRAEKNPYPWIPFTIAIDNKVPHELYGIGEIEPIESLQNELNDIRNQRMDNIKLNLNTMWKVVAGGVQFEDELVSRPGGIIHLTRPDGLQENVHRPIDGSVFTEESTIKADMEQTSGAGSFLSGLMVSPMGGTGTGVVGSKSAGALNAMIAQADKRFSSKVNHFKFALQNIGRQFLELDQKYMTKEQMIRVVGPEGTSLVVPILPEDIKHDFDLEIDIDYTDDHEKASQDISLLEALKGVPGFNASMLAADILERVGKKNVQKYLSAPPPAPEPPKIAYQFKGDVMPDAVAQIVNKTEGVQTHPEVVAAAMHGVIAGSNKEIAGAKQAHMQPEMDQAQQIHDMAMAQSQQSQQTNQPQQ